MAMAISYDWLFPWDYTFYFYGVTVGTYNQYVGAQLNFINHAKQGGFKEHHWDITKVQHQFSGLDGGRLECKQQNDIAGVSKFGGSIIYPQQPSKNGYLTSPPSTHGQLICQIGVTHPTL